MATKRTAKKRENRYDDYIGIPVEAELKREIARLGRIEEREMTVMARVLLKEAVARRKNDSPVSIAS